MQTSPFIIALLALSVTASAQELRKIELEKSTESYTNASMMGSNGMMTGGGSGSKARYHYTVEGTGDKLLLSFSGENLRAVLDSSSGAKKQMATYAAKRAGSIGGIVGFGLFALLSMTVGMEETGETTTKPNQYGDLETTSDKRVTGAGYTLLGLAGASAIGALYCNISRHSNLRRAIRLHNEQVANTRRTSLLLIVDF